MSGLLVYIRKDDDPSYYNCMELSVDGTVKDIEDVYPEYTVLWEDIELDSSMLLSETGISSESTLLLKRNRQWTVLNNICLYNTETYEYFPHMREDDLWIDSNITYEWIVDKKFIKKYNKWYYGYDYISDSKSSISDMARHMKGITFIYKNKKVLKFDMALYRWFIEHIRYQQVVHMVQNSKIYKTIRRNESIRKLIYDRYLDKTLKIYEEEELRRNCLYRTIKIMSNFDGYFI